MDAQTQRECVDRARSATVALRHETIHRHPRISRAVYGFVLLWPPLVSAACGGALPWWAPLAWLVVMLGGVAAYVQLRWNAWIGAGLMPRGGDKAAEDGGFGFFLGATVLSAVGGAMVGPAVGLTVVAFSLVNACLLRRHRRARDGWPRHDPRIRPSSLMSESPMLEIVTAFASVDIVRPSIVAGMLEVSPSAMESAIKTLRRYEYLQVGRFDGTETMFGLTELGRKTYAEHLRTIAPLGP